MRQKALIQVRNSRFTSTLLMRSFSRVAGFQPLSNANEKHKAQPPFGADSYNFRMWKSIHLRGIEETISLRGRSCGRFSALYDAPTSGYRKFISNFLSVPFQLGIQLKKNTRKKEICHTKCERFSRYFAYLR